GPEEARVKLDSSPRTQTSWTMLSTSSRCVRCCINCATVSVGVVRKRAGCKVVAVSDSRHVIARLRVDPDGVAWLHEEGDLQRVARFDRGRLGRAAGGIALEPGRRLGDFQLDGRGELNVQRLAIVRRDL